MNRPIVATLHRGGKIVWTRRYARIDTALPKLTKHAVMLGHPGDAAILHHDVTGLEIGYVKVHVGGRLSAKWIWD